MWQRLLNYMTRISQHAREAQYQNWGIALPLEVQQAADQVYYHG